MGSRDPHLPKTVNLGGTQMMDLFMRKRAFKVPQYFSAELSDKRGFEGDAMEAEGWGS